MRSGGKRVQMFKGMGIYSDNSGIGVIANMGTWPNKLTSAERRFPHGTATSVLKAAWLNAKNDLSKVLQQNGGKVTRGSIRAHMPEYFRKAQSGKMSAQRRQERTQQFEWWITQFGERQRQSLTTAEIEHAMHKLDHRSASTSKKYRTALSNMFTVLDGISAPNPVREVPKRKEPRAARRDQPYELIQVIIAKLRTNTSNAKDAGPSQARAFLWVLAYVPATVPQLVQMTSADVHWESGEITVPGRDKGEGSEGRRKSVSSEGMAALRNFDAGKWWGKTPTKSNLTRAFKTARDKAVAELRQTQPTLDLSTAHRMQRKDLRHSYLTAFFRLSGDLALTSKQGDHKSLKTTDRYTVGAVEPLLKAAGAKFNEGLAKIPPYVPPADPPAAEAPVSQRRKLALVHNTPRRMEKQGGEHRKVS